MRKIIIVLLVFISGVVSAQTPQTSYTVATIIQLKAYNGMANRIYVTETRTTYLQSTGIADEANIYAGAGGKKWQKEVGKISADSTVTGSTNAPFLLTEKAKLAKSIDSAKVASKIDSALNANTLNFNSTDFYGTGTSGNPLRTKGKADSAAMVSALAAKQASLVSGTSIKTINGSPILGAGDLSIAGTAGSVSFDTTTAFYYDTINFRLVVNRAGVKKRFKANDSSVVTNAAPVASSVALVGNDTVGRTRSTTYTYSDAESNTEGSTVKKYYTYTNTSGAGSSLVATASTYVIARADTGKYIRSSVTPYATSGTSPGTEVFSGYSGVIKDSASGGVGLSNLTLASSSGTVTESPTGTFSATTTATGIFNQSLPASTAGYIQMDVSSITAGSVLAFDLGNNVEGYAGLGYGVFHLSGTYYRCENGTLTNTSVTATTGDKCRVKRTGSTITAEYTTNGTTWTTLYTFSATTSAQLYSKFDITGTSFSIVNPKGSGVL